MFEFNPSQTLRCLWLPLFFSVALGSSFCAGATDVQKSPLQTDGLAKPNVIFGMDDSGSMDTEVLLNTTDGGLWWNKTSKTGWVTTAGPTFGKPLAPSPTTASDYNLIYLFPNGCGASGQRHLCDSSGYLAVPPIPQLASMRSSSYNPLYYNPLLAYTPWPTATISGVSKTFANASTTATPVHPLFPAVTMALTTNQSSTAADYVFQGLPGMLLPIGTVVNATSTTSGACSGSTMRTLTAAISLTTVSSCAISYYPATYWVAEDCTVDGTSCVTAPDGVTLHRYEIRSSVTTYPSGRSYAAELQNFANWFTYYRKRTLMVASSMGTVVGSLTGLRMGVVPFNAASTLTMYDTDATDPTINGQAVAGKFYGNLGASGTPTRTVLKAIGEMFRTNTSIIQYSCQRNAAFIVTDGFADATSTTPAAYSQTTWGAAAPYQTTYAGTLADIALSYYTNNPRLDLATGKVPAASVLTADPSADQNTNLHMNTYAITLGAHGTLWPSATNPYVTAPAWPNPTAQRSPTAIDDLWHATINGRGSMFGVGSPTQTAAAIQTALLQIMKLKGAQGGTSFHSVNISAGDATAYVGYYLPQGWGGDIEARSVNTTTGVIGDTALWSANAQLMAMAWSSRRIFTSNGGSGVAFTAANVGAIVNPSGSYGSNADVVAYLRGDQSKEGTLYRVRTGLFGAMVNADPAVSKPEGLVFAASNDGMLHALDVVTGIEQWAYIPSAGLSSLGVQTQKTWAFQTVLDGSPVTATISTLSGAKNIVVGGRGTAGPGYYALDVTAIGALPEAQMGSRVLWEFPNASTSASISSSMGASLGRPLVVNTHKYGWVALFTSGYNSTLDGKGRMFVVDLLTGALRYTFVTTQGSVGAADAGLAQISGFQESDGSVQYVYGGDVLGNMWRFDVEKSAVLLLAQLTDASGVGLPVTAAPELMTSNGRRMVFIGTGKLLGSTDFNDPRTHAFFGLWDNGTTITTTHPQPAHVPALAGQLALRTMSVVGNTRLLSGSAVDWTAQRGWYFDLPTGEKANTDPTVGYGMVVFTTNQPAVTSCASSSALYTVSAASGLDLAASQFITGSIHAGVVLGSQMTARAAVARLPSGQLVITTHQADNSTTTSQFNAATATSTKKIGWKEVIR